MMEEVKQQIYTGQRVWVMEPDLFYVSQQTRNYYTVTGKYDRFFTAERKVNGRIKKTSFLYAQVIQGEVHLT